MAKNNFYGNRGAMGGMGGMNMQQAIKQAQKMQEDMQKMQQQMKEAEFEAASGGGAVVALSPGDTRDLPFRTYLWDFRVIGPDGTVSTPMAAAAFTVAEVIGDA